VTARPAPHRRTAAWAPLCVALFALAVWLESTPDFARGMRAGGVLAAIHPVPGLLLALLLGVRAGAAPALVGAALVLHVLVGRLAVEGALAPGSPVPLGPVVARAATDVLVAVLGAGLLRRTASLPLVGTSRGATARFLLIGCLAVPLAGGLVGAGLRVALEPGAAFAAAFEQRVPGDALGILLLVPLGVGWLAGPPPRSDAAGRRETFLVLAALGVVGSIAWVGRLAVEGALHPALGVPHAALPFVVWAALRFSVRATAVALAAAAVIALAATLRADGAPVDPERLLAVQAYVALATASLLLLASYVDAGARDRDALRAQVAERERTARLLDESRRRMNALAEHVDAALWTYDRAEDRFTYVSPGYERIWGRSPGALYFDPDAWLEPVDPARADELRERWHRVRSGASDEPFDLVLRLAVEGRGERWVASRGFPMRDASGRVVGYAGNAIDVTDQREADERRREAERQLHLAHRMEAVGGLASGAAHEFNNLLTVMLAELSRLEALERDDPELAATVAALRRAVEQATSVTGSLLGLVRSGAAEREPVDLSATVQSAVDVVRHALPESVELEVALGRSPAPWVLADPAQIRQVVLNLALNARDAMPGGGTLHIAVTPAKATSHGPRAQLSIADDGCGMAPEVAARVFEPFFTTKERERGTGLGLSYVHRVALDHGGSVDVRSEPGEGTTFTLTLPCIPPPAAPLAAEPVAAKVNGVHPSAHGDDAPARGGPGARLLVAEDDDQVRAVVRAQLERLGHTVSEVRDGERLLERLESGGEDFALLVIDLNLPRKSGLECLRALRADRIDAPVLLVTGGAVGHLHASLDERTDVLPKPFSLSELSDAVTRMLAP